MASHPITSWQIDREVMETVANYFLGSKITTDGNRSHEIKRCLLQHKGFSVVNEVEVDVFLEFPCFFYDSADVGKSTILQLKGKK